MTSKNAESECISRHLSLVTDHFNIPASTASGMEELPRKTMTASSFETRSIHTALCLFLKPDGLEGTSHAVAQVKAKQRHGGDIECRHAWMRKTQDGHPVHIMAIGCIPQLQVGRIHEPHREVHQVVHDKSEQRCAAEDKGSRGITGFVGFVAIVLLRPGRAVAESQLHGGQNVQEKRALAARACIPQSNAGLDFRKTA